MAVELVVRTPFADYAIGQVINNTRDIEAIQGTSQEAFVVAVNSAPEEAKTMEKAIEETPKNED